MIWDEFLRHFRFCDEEDSGLSDEEQERKGPKNRPKHTRKRIHQAKKNFLEKFKTASKKLCVPLRPRVVKKINHFSFIVSWMRLRSLSTLNTRTRTC
ncbi:hypothetical protein [Bacteroides sp. An19]|uniref:hypothetical protein n=1 Tax=Bacteroides sp. An19 TaxID=1965580 RepID=UPI0013A64272|nr:hypothetical protein [Bacteroides sp. An19]